MWMGKLSQRGQTHDGVRSRIVAFARSLFHYTSDYMLLDHSGGPGNLRGAN